MLTPDAGTEKALVSGEVLCRQGEVGSDIFHIVSGSLEVIDESTGRELVVSTQIAGDTVGEITAALGGVRSATLRAAEDTFVRVVPYAAFAQWRDENPEAATELANKARVRFNRTRAAQVLTRLVGYENRSVVDEIIDQVTWRSLVPGEELFAQGDDATFASIIVTGRMQVTRVDEAGPGGVVTLDREVGRGEIVGELGVIEDAPRSATVHAIRDTTLALISRDAFHQLTMRHPRLMLQIFRSILQRLMRDYRPDSRARVVTVAVTAPELPAELLDRFAAAVAPFGSTLHLRYRDLARYIGDLDAPGATDRVAEFLREADVAHDFVIHHADAAMTDWSRRSVKQSDRLVIVCSARPDAEEKRRIAAFVDELHVDRRDSAWIARVHPSGAHRPANSGAFIDEFGVGEVHNLRADEGRDFERLGRLATGNGRGVVLGGGGARGIAHIGALRALHDVGISPDRIGGASMGSVLAGFAALDLSPTEMLTMATERLEDLMDFTVPLVSFITGKKMTAGMVKTWGDSHIEDFWLPFFCVSTNLTTSELCVHRRGPVVQAVRASVAIPGVLPPVPIGAHLHVDGGVLDNVPVTAMRDDSSIGTLIALDVSPPDGPRAKQDYGLSVSGFDVLKSRLSRDRNAAFPELANTLMSAMLIGSSQSRRDVLESGLVDLQIAIDTRGIPLLKFENHEAIEQRGYESAVPQIEKWLAEQ